MARKSSSAVRVALLSLLLGPGAAPGVAARPIGPLGPEDPVAALPSRTAPDTLRLTDALALARQANPLLRAARLRAEVARERIAPTGALPDPQLAFGLMNRPLDGFGASEPMTMNVVGLTQTLPWPGKLGFSEERSEHLAEAERLEADDAELSLLASVRSRYFQLAYIDRALTIMEGTRQLLRELYRVSSVMYGVGSGLQQDVLQAEVAVARMTADITVIEQERLATAARLNALLGRAASTPVGATELAEIGIELASVDTLIAAAAARRPALQAARERVRAAEAGYRAARRQLYPDIRVSVSYNQRPEFVDMASLTVGLSVPLWAGSRQLPQRREMEALQAQAEAEALELYNETYARLAELRARAERARSLYSLYEQAILPQAQAAVESALSAYRVGRVDYMTLLGNQMTVNNYQIESVRLRAEYQRALAEIEALIGGETGGAQ